MNEIRRVLARASRRLLALDVLRCLALTLSGAIIVLIALLLAQRIFAFEFTFQRDWVRAFAIAGAGALVAAIVWAYVRRRREVSVARELDERAGLRESLSTALCVEREPDAWARVVVETARQRAVGVDVRRAIPIEAPRLWPLAPSLALSMAILWFSVPQMDVLGALKRRTSVQQNEAEIVQAKLDAKATDEKLKELMQKAKVEFSPEELKASDAQADKPLTPDEIRRAAIKRLTSLQEKLENLKQGDKAKELEGLRQQMKQLKQPGPGPMDSMTKALQKGDFAQAKEELEKLKEKLADGSLSEKDKDQAKQQMEKVAEQLSKLAQSQQQLEQKLQEAGMSKEQAQKAAQEAMKNPDSLSKALDQLPGIPTDMKQALRQAAQQQSQSNGQCKNMSESMSQMAQGMSKQGMSQQGQEGMQNMSGQLSELEQMDKEMQSASAAMDEAMKQSAKLSSKCNGGDGEGEKGQGSGDPGQGKTGSWKAGESAGKQGKGSGNAGQSGGGKSPDEIDSPVEIAQQKSPTKLTSGPIIGSRLVQGEQVRGESVAEYEAAVTSAQQNASKALETMTVRKELQGAVKHYFGRLEAKAKPSEAPPKGDGDKK